MTNILQPLKDKIALVVGGSRGIGAGIVRRLPEDGAGIALTYAADTLPNPDLVAALPRLRRYARVLTGDVHRADDLVQDTLARAWDKRRLWRAGSDLRAWLFAIMHNVHVNQFWLRRREGAHVSLDADDGRAAGWEVPVRATQSDRIEVNEVFAQLGRLPVEQREVLILAAVEELRYDEIARVLSVPIGTVMSRLSRARERLRRMVGARPSPL